MQPILEIEGVSRHFGGVVALDELDFVLEAGELCSIIGPNGCGKTTLFNVVTGALAPSAGRIRAAGADITNWPPFRIARAGICRKFQVPGIYPSLSVAENLEVPRTGASGRWRAWRLLWHSGDAEVLAEMLAWCGLAGNRIGRPGRSPMARSSGSRSPCSSPPAGRCSCSTSRRPG